MSMDAMNIDKIISQMRVLAAQAAGQTSNVEVTSENSFASTLKNTLSKVNDLQVTANSLQESFERGDKNLKVAEVMIASKKAEVTFQATVQVRNKLVQAYKEIMDMPI